MASRNYVCPFREDRYSGILCTVWAAAIPYLEEKASVVLEGVVPVVLCELSLGFCPEPACSSPGWALLLLVWSWTGAVRFGVPVLPLCSSPWHPAESGQQGMGALQQLSPGYPGGLSFCAALLAWAFLWVSERSDLLEAEFMIMLLGRRCPKLSSFILPSNSRTGGTHALTGLILNSLPRAEVLVSPAEPHFLKPSRFLYKKTHFCCSLNPVGIMEES